VRQDHSRAFRSEGTCLYAPAATVKRRRNS